MPIANFDLNPNQLSSLASSYQKVKANMANTGTVNGQTQAQNLAAVINQPGNTAINDPAKHAYLQSQLDQAARDTAAQQHVNTPAAPPQPPTQVQQLQQAQQSQPQQSASNGNADLINSMYDQNYASQLQKLRDSRDQQLAGLANQDNVIGQNRISQLNNNDATAAQQMKALQESMANNGLSASGDNVSAQIANQTAQGQNANSIEQNSGNQLKDLAALRGQINNAASANDLALMQQLQATRSGQLIDNNNTQDQRALQLAQLMGTYNGAPTLAAQGQQFNQGIAQAGLTGQYGGQQTMQAQNQTFNQGQQNWQNKFNYGQSTGQFDNGQQTLDKQKLDTAGQQFAASNKLDWAKLSLDQRQMLGQLAISQQNADTNATQAANSYALGSKNADIAQQNADSEGKLRDAQGIYYGDRGNNLTPGTDKAYKDAVTLAQKDPLFSTYTPDKQQSIINTHYENLKAKTPANPVSDATIQQFLKK